MTNVYNYHKEDHTEEQRESTTSKFIEAQTFLFFSKLLPTLPHNDIVLQKKIPRICCIIKYCAYNFFFIRNNGYSLQANDPFISLR